MSDKNFPLLCPNCLLPFIVKRMTDTNIEVKKNKKRSEVICSQCGMTIKEAILQKLKESDP